MPVNRISAVLSDTDRDAVLAAIDTIRTTLPFLVDLTPEERMRLPKFSDETQGFPRLALQVAQQNPDEFPARFDVAEFEKDLALMDALAPVRTALTQLLEHVEDTHLLLRHEGYVDSLYVYRTLRDAPAGAALDELARQLGLRFARGSQGGGGLPGDGGGLPGDGGGGAGEGGG